MAEIHVEMAKCDPTAEEAHFVMDEGLDRDRTPLSYFRSHPAQVTIIPIFNGVVYALHLIYRSSRHWSFHRR